MRRLPSTVLGLLAAATLAGCGQANADLIPESNARALRQTADRIDAACSDADRSEARAQVRQAEREIDALPRAADKALVQNLRDWIKRIEDRIPDDCRAEEAATPAPTVTEPEPAETPSPTPTEAPQEPVETPTAAPTEAPTEAPPVEPTPTPPPA